MLKPLKYALMFIGGALTLALFISVTVKGVNHFEGNRYVKPYVKLADGTPLKEENPDGTVNGLNLLLIDSIQTEGYVKEYLSIAKDLSEGKLGKLNFYSSVARTLGVAATEQGTYPGLPILGSPLPLDSNGGPKWDKSISLTLSDAYREQYEQYGYSSSFVRAGNLTGDYFGPWQVRVSYLENGLLEKSSVSTKSSIDMFHFRDQMYAYAQVRDWKYADIKTKFGDIEISDDAKDMYVSILYSGSPIYTYLHGDTPEEKAKSLEEVYTWTHSTFVKDYNAFLTYPDLTAGWVAKFQAIMLNVKNGGKISQKTYNYATTGPQRGKCQQMLDIWGINSSVEDFLSPAIDSNLPAPGLSDGTISGMMSNIVNGKIYYMIPESTGHYVGEEALGPYYYGAMLKYAGVDVDPTNPSTYMNSLPEGEWKPSGNSEWMGEFNINPTEIGSKRTSFLNEAHKWIGSWYAWGGNQPPEKDSNGEWIQPTLQPNGWSYEKGFDCSSFIQYSLKTALNIDISRTTWSQRANANTYVISESELKPGDLVYYWGADLDWGHVSIYIGKDSNGKVNYLHSPVPGQRIGFTTWNGQPEYSILEYRRVKGLD